MSSIAAMAVKFKTLAAQHEGEDGRSGASLRGADLCVMSSSRMLVIEGPDVGREFPISDEGGGIGRAEGNVVRLSDLSASRQHCTIEPRGGRLALVDPGSLNNTRINGQLVTEHALVEGDELLIGKSRLVDGRSRDSFK